MPLVSHRWFSNLSLAAKLTVLATATAALSTTVLAVVLGTFEVSRMRSRLVGDTEMLVDRLGASASAPLVFDDRRTATETVAASAANDQIQTAVILKRDGTTLGRYDRPNRGDGHDALPLHLSVDELTSGRRLHAFVDNSLVVISPVVLKNELLGSAYVELDLSDLRNATRRLWLTFLLALAGTLVLGGLIAWRLQRLVSAPLLRLTEMVRRVGQTADYASRTVRDSDDEVGELADGFNEMLEALQRRDLSLETHRIELEHTVEQRTAELRASLERHRLLVENTQIIPWEVDGRTLVFRYISPQVSRFGFDPDRLTNRLGLDDLIHPDDRATVRARLAQLAIARHGEELDLDHRVVAAGQAVADVRTVVTCDRTDGTVVLRGFSMDVTRQKKLEMELRQSQKLESVGRLAAGVAHEINTPVQFVSDSVIFVRDSVPDVVALLHQYDRLRAAVRAGTATAADLEPIETLIETSDLDYLIENVPKALDRSLEGLDRVSTIVKSMKEFAHPDQVGMAPVDINKAVQSTLTIARNEYKYVADLEMDLGELPLVTCHGGDVNQAILNIVVNAAHAIEDLVGQSERKGHISVQTRRVGAEVVIRISDTGGGIPDQIRERIFDPFFTTKVVGRGTGQGLAIARSVVVEKHGGRLTFQSEPGVGTTFEIRLPINGRQAATAVA